jgi:hypothetical protein
MSERGSVRAGRRGALAALALALLCGLGWGAPERAEAAEPLRVLAEGAVPLDAGNETTLRARALEAALREAVYQAALGLVAADRLAGREAELREELAPRASQLVLTYTLEGAPERRPDPAGAGGELFALRVAVTVDGERLRARLLERGWIASGPSRPSVVLRVVGADGARPAPLLELERGVAQKLAEQGYVMVDANLFPSPGGLPEASAALGRRVGADVAVELSVRREALSARTAQSVPGARAEVTLRAVRVADVSELALARFEAPGYNADPERAFSTALEALRDQLAQSLLFQLDRNAEALRAGSGALRLRLSEVGSLVQVEAVQKALLEQLGARSASLALIESGSVELVVEGPLSAGALQERLASLAFEGFSLEVAQVDAGAVTLRVRASAVSPAAGPRSELRQIDTRSVNG